MDLTGKIVGISNNFLTKKFELAVSVNEADILKNGYEKLKSSDLLDIRIVKHRNRRSLDANAYMWVLLQKMAEVLLSSKDEMYLKMLSIYGQFTHIVVKPHVVDKVKEQWRTVRELGEIKVNGQEGIQLQCFFGSSTYDTKEMSFLIDGVVSECKKLGIETLPMQEIDRMKQEWGVDIAQKN